MILTVTFNPAIDHTYVVDSNLAEEHIIRTDESHFDAGGKGINVASYLNDLGHDAIATGLLGGFTGKFIRNELDNLGLDHDFAEGGITRINTTIAGENEHKINHSGPETEEEAVDRVIEKVASRNPDKVIISGSLPPGLDSSAIDSIEKAVDGEVVVDLHGDTLGLLEQNYFMAKPNREELSEATGMRAETVGEAFEAARSLREDGFEIVVASLGSEGALLVSDEKSIFAEGLDSEVVDTTGAGDALLSAMIAYLEEGLGEGESLVRALAFATLVVETAGTGSPDLEDFEEYVEKVDVREL
ncbi:1-phosphofructokinase [Candidatus Nanohalovita haloferacivicina]|uniref:1-phosphofructokinase n=1 Tax=Candidatus Nanohalovita haloferacivicina TaxID=2978046 RepID=UPI00325FA533|nr:1-phosphofructokinase [Candidatus Nanohalobia archaeon BNXNv]